MDTLEKEYRIVLLVSLCLVIGGCGGGREGAPSRSEQGTGGPSITSSSEDWWEQAGSTVGCAVNMDTETPWSGDVTRAHANGNEEYGARTPADILTRMAKGQDPVTGIAGGQPPDPGQSAYLREFAAVVEAETRENPSFEESVIYEGPAGGILTARKVADRWFATSYSVPVPCSPFDLEPDDQRREELLTLIVDPSMAAPGEEVRFRVPENLTEELAVEVHEWTVGWEPVAVLTKPDITVPAEWEPGHYLLCLTQEPNAPMGTRQCGALEVTSP